MEAGVSVCVCVCVSGVCFLAWDLFTRVLEAVRVHSVITFVWYSASEREYHREICRLHSASCGPVHVTQFGGQCSGLNLIAKAQKPK